MNVIIREIANELREIFSESSSAQIYIRTITFSDSAGWVEDAFVPVHDFSWMDQDLQSISNLGKAFEKISAEFKGKIPDNDMYGQYRIVLILISDGYPTDNWKMPLEDMRETLKGRTPVYCVIRLPGASEEVTTAFAGEGPDKNLRIMTYDDIENIIQLVR